jgi:hypothetical protein
MTTGITRDPDPEPGLAAQFVDRIFPDVGDGILLGPCLLDPQSWPYAEPEAGL